MRADPDLPFSDKIKKSTTLSSRASHHGYLVAASAARKVFDDALEAGRIKAELEVQAAVAAAAKAASKREEDAALLREGGEGVEDVIRNMPETQVADAFAFDGTDSHFVTLKRLHIGVRETVAGKAEDVLNPEKFPEEKSEGTTGRPRNQILTPMPDARLLDHRLFEILAAIENAGVRITHKSEDDTYRLGGEMSMLYKMRKDVLYQFHGDRLHFILREYAGVGLAAAQCGTKHRNLNDGTDYGYGSASPMLFQVAYGTDAPRYLRALGVPMNLTRFAVSALAYADRNCAEQLFSVEHERFYGKDEGKDDEATSKTPVVSSTKSSAEPPSNEDKSEEAGLLPKENAETASKEESTKDSPKKQWSETGKESGKTPGEPAVRKALEPSLLVSEEYRNDSKTRAAICLGVLMYGFPRSGVTTLSADVLALVSPGTDAPVNGFSVNQFRDCVQLLCSDLVLPSAASIAQYVESSLLPHCLRLCLYGNGPVTEARGSQGEYETAIGVSLHSAPSSDLPCPLPDPCIEQNLHSLEALGCANAILRRTQLLRSSQYICSGTGTTADQLSLAARSKLMDSADNLPVWWCPWVHDVALLVRTATNGVFAILYDRSRDTVFSEGAVGAFLRTSLENQPFPFANHLSSPELLDEWIQYESAKFPTLLQLERRLAFLSAKASADAPDLEDRFVALPMFDHGGWPRD